MNIRLLIFLLSTLFNSSFGYVEEHHDYQMLKDAERHLPNYKIAKGISEPNREKPAKKKSELLIYKADIQAGSIGTSEDNAIDQAYDNIFHIELDRQPKANDKVWLKYELKGVENHAELARSINDRPSVGGYIIHKSENWKLQSELISHEWLKVGNNVFRFSIHENSGISYQIRNLRLEIEKNESKQDKEKAIVLSVSNFEYNGEYAYLKGFITGHKCEYVSVQANHKEIDIFEGEFECILKKPVDVIDEWIINLEATYPDQSSVSKKILLRPEKNKSINPIFSSAISKKGRKVLANYKPSEKLILSTRGASLKIPENALPITKEISITPLRAIDLAPLPSELINVTGKSTGYRLLPHGTQFNNLISLEIDIDTTLIPVGYTKEDVRTYFFDEKERKWKAIPKDEKFLVGHSVHSITNHFTDFINGIIKVPKSPETEGYVPTKMKDIKAGNPSANIELIEPPSPNNQGTANLSMPIKIPNGRNGMQPQVGISYNSSGGNGWLGLNWDLSTPSISIETRWGVPRYDQNLETETYLLNGEQLYPVAHREEWKARYPDGKIFHRRVEGTFERIIRHGDSPKNYWWEVTDKTGTTNCYGGLPESGISENSILRTATNSNGNVVHWCLTRTRDANGNFVRYYYDKVNHSGVTGSPNQGSQIYIDRITYTGHNDEEGKYQIKLFRDRELPNFVERPDVNISCRLGFKQVTADLLKRIEVYLEDEIIRSYDLNYREGAFLKTLLESCLEFDKNGNLFTEHNFEYYDDVRNENLLYQPLSSAQNWSVVNDEIEVDFKNPISSVLGEFNGKSTLLSGSKSSSKSVGGAATIGVGTNLGSKILSVGGSRSYSRSEGNGLNLLADINGDNLPDKVFSVNEALWYRPNLFSFKNQSTGFGDTIKVLGNVDKFSFSKTKSRTTGIEAHPFDLFIGRQKNKSKTRTSTYIVDVNGDGLLDIKDREKIYFNRKNANEKIEFQNDNSIATPNQIYSAGELDANIIEFDPLEQEELIDDNPLHDVVRLWVAPYSGNVTIKAPITLIGDLSSMAYGKNDGVKAKIQHEDLELDSVILLPDLINFNNIGPIEFSNVSQVPIFVNAGDRIYFRLQSIEDGAFDKVHWNPEINYTENSISNSEVDANGKYNSHYKPSDDFLLASCQTTIMPVGGVISIDGIFEKPITTDNLLVQIKNNNDIIFMQEFEWSASSSEHIQFDINVNQDDEIIFEVISETNVDWTSIKWTPSITYILLENGIPAIDSDSIPLLSFCPAVDFTMFNQIGSRVVPFEISTIGPDTISIDPNVIYDPFNPFVDEDGEIVFSVKGRKKLYGKSKITFTNGIPNTLNGLAKIEFILPEEESLLYLEFHTTSFDIFEKIEVVDASISIPSDSLVTGLIGNYGDIEPKKIIFGNLYRGWGQFGYNGNREKANQPINQDSLDILEPELKEENDINNLEDPSDIPSVDDRTRAPFILFVSNPKEMAWIGYDEFTYIKADTASSARLGDDDISIESFTSSNGEIFLPDKVSKASMSSNAFGGGIAGISASYSESNGATETELDVFDLNGDRYPDIIGIEKIQYTLPLGGLESHAKIQHNIKNHNSVNEANGYTLGGTYIGSGSFNTNASQFVSWLKLPKEVKKDLTNNANRATEKARASIGINIGSISDDASDETIDSWIDINGDGLVDKVLKNGMVRLNIGYSFLPMEVWNFDEIKKGKSDDTNAGGNLGINYGNYSVSAGLSLSRTDNEATHSLQDVSGDGMVDIIEMGNPIKVRLNTGNKFHNQPISWNGANFIDKGSSTGEAVNAAFTICFPIPLLFVTIKICVNPSGSIGQGVSRQESQLSDINGDGYPDFLKSGNDGDLVVRSSTIGRTNLLRQVNRPLHSSFSLDYKLEGATYNLPSSKWVMSELTINDGLPGDGASEMKYTYEYEDGFHNRRERAFYGFANVKSHQLNTENDDKIYRTTVYSYDNSTYHRKGLLLNQRIEDYQGNPFEETQNTYILKDLNGGILSNAFDELNASGTAFPALMTTIQSYYEGDSTNNFQHTINYEYNVIGNITYYQDLGNTLQDDVLSANISYHDKDSLYIKSSPSSIKVYADNALERHRETNIDDKGNVTQIRQFLDSSVSANHDMTYDKYGNLESIIRPGDTDSSRLEFTYTYDDLVQTYVEEVIDGYGYTSSNTYDLLFGQLIESTDINGNKIKYGLDVKGRIDTIIGTYELASGMPYTIVFDYQPKATVPYALTKHYDPELGGDIETITFMDGLQRPVQVKKTGMISDATGSSELKYIVSGRNNFDAFGRTVETFYPTVEDISNGTTFKLTPDSKAPPTKTEFDVLDRPVKVILPDTAISTTIYSIKEDNENHNCFLTLKTDPLGLVNKEFADIRTRKKTLSVEGPNGTIWTNFHYNAISELLDVVDMAKDTIAYKYDQLGRKLSVDHPNRGLTEFEYDLANNMTKRITAVIRTTMDSTASIDYTYDKERLIQIDYPRNYQNRVNYHYGEAGADHNRAGRIWLQEDASGGQEFFYGVFGEIEKNIRTIIVDPITQLTYVSQYKYDTWNRIQEMKYPDGEHVIYDYNEAGKLTAMHGMKEGHEYDYVDHIGYDEFEQRFFLRYGNGTTTTYAYDPQRRWMDALKVDNPTRSIMDNVYAYDAVANITSVENRAEKSVSFLGGRTKQDYTYDVLYRLSTASGSFDGYNRTDDFTLSMAYDDVHNIVSKNQTHQKGGTTHADNSYNLSYTYNDLPHAPSNIVPRNYTYDANGNQTGWIDTSDVENIVEREIYWDEEDRVRGIIEDGYKSQYTYDAGGERVIKSHGAFQGAFINGTPAGFVVHDDNYTLYVSPYLVATGDRFTKHYFIEGQRINSKLGIGTFRNNILPPKLGITAGNKDYVRKMQLMEDALNKEYANEQGLAPGHPTLSKYYRQTDIFGTPYPSLKWGNYDRPNDAWPQGDVFDTIKAPGHPTIPDSTYEITNDNVEAGYGYDGHPIIREDDQFFYHSDHLGSSNFLTDIHGVVRQHVEYIPFGATFVDEHRSDESQPYLFNGKELDAETDLYYYGARYYDPRSSLWLSVDPMFEKYPGWSAYNYTLQNPVKFVDPDGRKVWPINKSWVNPDGKVVYRKLGDGFRTKKRPGHGGIDMNLGAGSDDFGAPVLSTHTGTAAPKDKSDKNGAGNRNHIISKDGKVKTSYFHLKQEPSISGTIKEGEKIGELGGSANGKEIGGDIHLHYEISIKDNEGNWQKINPVLKNGELIDVQKMIEKGNYNDYLKTEKQNIPKE